MNHSGSLVIQRDDYASYTQLDNEIVILAQHNHGEFYLFNETAADLWLALEAPKSVLELAQILAKKYLGTPEDYLQDVLEWLDDTRLKGLLIS